MIALQWTQTGPRIWTGAIAGSHWWATVRAGADDRGEWIVWQRSSMFRWGVSASVRLARGAALARLRDRVGQELKPITAGAAGTEQTK